MVRFIKKDIKINIYIYKMNVVIKWKDHSPRSFINKVIYEPVPKKKKGKKVKEVDFKIIEMKNYQTLLDNNWLELIELSKKSQDKDKDTILVVEIGKYS